MAVPIIIISSWPRNKQSPQLRVLLLLLVLQDIPTHHLPNHLLPCVCGISISLVLFYYNLYLVRQRPPRRTRLVNKKLGSVSQPHSLPTHPSNRSADNTTVTTLLWWCIWTRVHHSAMIYHPPPSPLQEWYLFRLTKTTLFYIIIILIIVLGIGSLTW